MKWIATHHHKTACNTWKFQRTPFKGMERAHLPSPIPCDLQKACSTWTRSLIDFVCRKIESSLCRMQLGHSEGARSACSMSRHPSLRQSLSDVRAIMHRSVTTSFWICLQAANLHASPLHMFLLRMMSRFEVLRFGVAEEFSRELGKKISFGLVFIVPIPWAVVWISAHSLLIGFFHALSISRHWVFKKWKSTIENFNVLCWGGKHEMISLERTSCLESAMELLFSVHS